VPVAPKTWCGIGCCNYPCKKIRYRN